VVAVKINRDNMTGGSHHFGFVSFDSFESSDNAIQAMNGQFVCNRPVHVSYAYKRDTKAERHGTMAERVLAANKPHARPMSWNSSFLTPHSTSTPMFNSLVTTTLKPPPVPPRPPPTKPPVRPDEASS
jgi:splicing factor 3B subunit 4